MYFTKEQRRLNKRKKYKDFKVRTFIKYSKKGKSIEFLSGHLNKYIYIYIIQKNPSSA